MTSEAQKKACRKYYAKTKGSSASVHIRLNTEKEGDVVAKLDSVPCKKDYLVGLVRKDIGRPE